MLLPRAGRPARLAAIAGVLAATGCLSPTSHRSPVGPEAAAEVVRAVPPDVGAIDRGNGKGEDPGSGKDKEYGKDTESGSKAKDEPKGPPKTIFEWSDGLCGTAGKNGDSGNGNGGDTVEKEKPLDTDRPDFGVATTTVGLGRAILETGYTRYLQHTEGSRFSGHSYPDALLRVGLFADWFEFRIGQSHASFRTTTAGGSGQIGGPEPSVQSGFQDTYLGVKLALTEQKSFLPESVILLQANVPTGSKDLTAGRVLPGAIYSFGWDVVEEKLDLSGLIEADKVVDAAGNAYVQLAQTAEVRYWWTPKFRTFLEWVALYPTAARTPGIGPQYYIHPGMTYFVTNDIQLDAHVFIGLNKHSVDFFGGPGLSVRY
jgi:hypothetical protein